MPRKEKPRKVGHAFETTKETLGEDIEAVTEQRDEWQETITEREAELTELQAELAEIQSVLDRLTQLYNAEP